MAKNIIVCFDGTWDGPDAQDKAAGGVYTPSNVQKLFEALLGSGQLEATDLEKEITANDASGAPVQAGKYFWGIGDATNLLAQKVEGAVGIGLIARIVRGYTYLSRLYKPADRIYIVGFSRGAYTARALAGFVANQGLLDWEAMQLNAGTSSAYSAGIAGWQRYKSTLHVADNGLLHFLANEITTLHDYFAMGLGPAPRLQFVQIANLEAVGVWDTVGALGIPTLRAKDGTLIRKDVFEFTNNVLDDRVKSGFQAIAVDEQRVDFTPSIWASRPGVIQVLFPGAHADVGGGYPPTESGLAGCALIWMARHLSAVGVLFSQVPKCALNPLDIQHRPWLGSAFTTALRNFPPNLALSVRVLQRMAAPGVPVEGAPSSERYFPKNLVNSYILPDESGPALHTVVEA